MEGKDGVGCSSDSRGPRPAVALVAGLAGRRMPFEIERRGATAVCDLMLILIDRYTVTTIDTGRTATRAARGHESDTDRGRAARQSGCCGRRGWWPGRCRCRRAPPPPPRCSGTTCAAPPATSALRQASRRPRRSCRGTSTVLRAAGLPWTRGT